MEQFIDSWTRSIISNASHFCCTEILTDEKFNLGISDEICADCADNSEFSYFQKPIFAGSQLSLVLFGFSRKHYKLTNGLPQPDYVFLQLCVHFGSHFLHHVQKTLNFHLRRNAKVRFGLVRYININRMLSYNLNALIFGILGAFIAYALVVE